MNKRAAVFCALALLILAVGCVRVEPEQLMVEGGELVAYQCDGEVQIDARYYSLSDGSLHFTKVTMPDGETHTLPSIVSASGARYTDERQWVWWTKGDTAFAETRTQSGEWQVAYENCQQVSSK